MPSESQRHEVARHGAGLGSGVPSLVAWAFGHCHGWRRWSGLANWKQQAFFLPLGLIGATIAACVPLHLLRKHAGLLGLLVAGLLVVLLLPGVPESLVRPRNGARRWISLVVFDLQPSELARVAWCLLMARLLYAGDAHRRLSGLLRPVALTAIAGGLIVVEPDLGTTLLFVPAFVTILIAAGGRIRHLLMFLVPAALIPVLLIGGMLLAPEAGEARLSQVLKPHQVDRIVAYTAQLRGDPRYDDDIGYQAAKALLATASGGVTGLGREGAARAVRLSGLPEAHNDMVFAVLVAQHGALGAVVVLGLYVAFGIGGLLIARSCAHPFGRLVAVGITTMLVSQALVHASMTLGLLPITGITLPLVSYGGSSLVTTWGMIGVLVGLAMTPSGRKQEERWDFAFGSNPS